MNLESLIQKLTSSKLYEYSVFGYSQVMHLNICYKLECVKLIFFMSISWDGHGIRAMLSSRVDNQILMAGCVIPIIMTRNNLITLPSMTMDIYSNEYIYT